MLIVVRTMALREPLAAMAVKTSVAEGIQTLAADLDEQESTKGRYSPC
jgi:hypothetical protein